MEYANASMSFVTRLRRLLTSVKDTETGSEAVSRARGCVDALSLSLTATEAAAALDEVTRALADLSYEDNPFEADALVYSARVLVNAASGSVEQRLSLFARSCGVYPGGAELVAEVVATLGGSLDGVAAEAVKDLGDLLDDHGFDCLDVDFQILFQVVRVCF